MKRVPKEKGALVDVTKYDFACQKLLRQGLQLAKSFGHTDLEVEHIALAMLRSGWPVSDHEGTIAAVRAHLKSLPKVFGKIRIKFGARLNAALDQAEGIGKLVTPADLWTALTKESSLLKGIESQNEQEQVTPASTSLTPEEEQALDQYATDLTGMAERDDLDPVIGRDFEVRRVIESLSRKKKNNPLLLGEPGVGKSAIAEALAQRVVSGQVPETMRGWKVLSLDLAALLSGARYRGEFEERFLNLLAALKRLSGESVLFIDEIHMIIGSGNQEGSADLANLLKPALARGELRCMGATTRSEFKRYFEKDAALVRRFQPIQVEEPTAAATLTILRGLRTHYESYHGIPIDDSALSTAVEMGSRYLSERRFPDKAIDLLDEACAKAKVESQTLPNQLFAIRSRLTEVSMEKSTFSNAGLATKTRAMVLLDVEESKLTKQYDDLEKCWKEYQALLSQLKLIERSRTEQEHLLERALNEGDVSFASRVRHDELPRLTKEREECDEQMKVLVLRHPWLHHRVGAFEVAGVVEQWTGVPRSSLLSEAKESVQTLEKDLFETIVGQDEALKTVISEVKRSQSNLFQRKGPRNVMFFSGPTGTGKTETAKCLARSLGSNPDSLIRIDMSEFAQPHQVARLTGPPPGYVGYGEGGQLTEPVRRNPWCVVLLDEVEKADPSVFDILLQIFDDGRLTDGEGRVVDFSHCIFIMTSNFPLYSSTDEGKRQELVELMRPELVGRIGEIVKFNALSKESYTKILFELIYSLNAQLSDRQLRVVLSDSMVQTMVGEVYNTKYGVRGLRRSFERQVVEPLIDLMNDNATRPGVWELSVDSDNQPRWRSGANQQKLIPGRTA